MDQLNFQDQDLLNLFSALVNSEVSKNVLKVIFTKANDVEIIDKLLDTLENVNDND